MNKDLRKLMRKARQAGWRVKKTRAGHLKWYPPAADAAMVVSALTPSCSRALANIRAELRKRGLEV